METITLDLACGPDDQRCLVKIIATPDSEEFVDCKLRINLAHQLTLELTGFLFYWGEYELLKNAFANPEDSFEKPLGDVDGLLSINAVRVSSWVEWSFVWEGIYPVFPPFDPNSPSNSRVEIRGLRAGCGSS